MVYPMETLNMPQSFLGADRVGAHVARLLYAFVTLHQKLQHAHKADVALHLPSYGHGNVDPRGPRERARTRANCKIGQST